MSHYTCTVAPQTTGNVNISLTGDIDFGARGDLVEALRATSALAPRNIHADLSGVSFFSAEGATFLVRLQALADGSMLSLLLDAPSRPVQRVLDNLGLTDAFRVGATVG